MAVTFPARAPRLVGDAVVLSQLDESLISDYVELISDAEVVFWTATTQTFSPEQLLEWLKSRPGAAERLDWAVFDAVSGDFAGEIVLNEYQAEEGSMNLRIALRSAQTSRGFGTEAVRLVCDYAFKVLGIRRITLDVLASNERAIRSYLKTGFSKYSEVIESGSVFYLMELRSSKG